MSVSWSNGLVSVQSDAYLGFVEIIMICSLTANKHMIMSHVIYTFSRIMILEPSQVRWTGYWEINTYLSTHTALRSIHSIRFRQLWMRLSHPVI